MKKPLFMLMTHALAAAIGFAAGIYFLPILIAPPAPPDSEVQAMAQQAQFTGTFRRDLQDSDAFHWGEGAVSISPKAVTLQGELAPGPDYKLYLSPEFVETEQEFNRLKEKMARVGDVKTFQNFVVEVPAAIDPSAYNAVIIWCESFGQFITAAKYQ
ncbi:MAG TPA: DM13 domain-containing protein [Burkholderiales bacterium]|nr:DM13 domain-containing protein [Burkholderiales bacterium]